MLYTLPQPSFLYALRDVRVFFLKIASKAFQYKLEVVKLFRLQIGKYKYDKRTIQI